MTPLHERLWGPVGALVFAFLAAPSTPSIEAWVGGCARWETGGQCLTTPGRPLTLWLPGSTGVPRLRVDGGDIDARWDFRGGGWATTLELEGARQVAVVTDQGAWAASLGSLEPEAVLDAARALRSRGEHAAAADHLAGALGRVPSRRVPEALGLLARERFIAGEDAQAEVAALEDAMFSLQPATRTSDAAFAAKVHLTRGRLAAARASLRETNARPSLDAAFNQQFMLGEVGSTSGDLRLARSAFNEASAWAERLGDPVRTAQTRQVLAGVYLRAGREDDAVDVLDGREPDLPPCDASDFLTSRGWTNMLARRGDPTRDFEAALQLVDDSCMRPALKRSNILLNLAILAVNEGRFDDARRQLATAQLRPGVGDPIHHLWALETEARIATSEGAPTDALDRWTALRELAGRAASLEFEARAALGAARVLATLGRRDAAINQLAEATHLFELQASFIPIDLGLTAAEHGAEDAARAAIPLLVEADRVEEAFALLRALRGASLARQSQAVRVGALDPVSRAKWDAVLGEYQSLRNRVTDMDGLEWSVPTVERTAWNEERNALAERARQTLDSGLSGLRSTGRAALRAPGPGDLFLAWFETDRGWYGFAADAESVRVSGPTALDTNAPLAELSQALLAPFAEPLAGAARVTLLPTGRLRALDLHAMPLDGTPIALTMSVAYSADLPPSPRERSGRVLIVSDPLSDLPGARGAGGRLAARMLQGGWQVTHLDGKKAGRDAILAAMHSVDRLVYLGHGRDDGGPWEGELLLANGEVSVPDILAVGRGPDEVLLLGCETASGGASTAERSGVGQGFLAVGASLVLGTTRAISDSAATMFADALAGSQDDLQKEVRAALVELRSSPAGAEWSAFRVLVP